MKALTPQEEQFCLEYVGNGRNGPKAAEAAGYIGNFKEIARELLKRSEIKAEIALYKRPKVIDGANYWDARERFGE